MSRKEDVIKQYMEQSGLCLLSERTQKHITDAMAYCFDQGESFGRYEKYAEKVEGEYLIQPENDRAWKKELDDIMKDCKNITCRSNENKTVRLLGLIAEMILYTRRGG